ncbi:ATP-grasp domain-containing protein [Sinanaerobacter sp. ZZT-01]|uniref:ATP-grasp domain-containing protein n=1 Tax=Sinanaerobacter sp. ZZT-01 TaxID=3111540 RepID=UPI002D76E3F9|nr:ATP-grasp domain-containing protein [Sinanaerobacter sp. ZZT-01]WRR93669.1 ATP-grasp domain-containing protein [Sinanaerobacter sp. ZZT-01]
MLILDKPYASDFLKKTAEDRKIPILDNGGICNLVQNQNLNLLSENDFFCMAKEQNPLKLYCNSENSINKISENLLDTKIPGYIHFCKDKIKFREKIKPLYPDFYFREVAFEDIKSLDVTCLKKPFIIKPAVGFFSIGVYKVESDKDWEKVVDCLIRDVQSAEGLYPNEVMDSSKFIIEECIDGEEFAIDAYYDAKGMPVILDILKHPFSSSTDVSDRVYYTSKEIILTYLKTFENILKNIGDLAEFQNFPVHVEVRIDQNQTVLPIEFNPMRFAGWCVTDIAYFAYGINVYEYFFADKKPDWEKILNKKDERVYSLVLVDVPKRLQGKSIKSFDYKGVSSKFRKVLEMREIDFHEYPVFAFLYIETKADLMELKEALNMDFSEFISMA